MDPVARKAVVIYHANCIDGFASAWAFHQLKERDYPDGVKYLPCNYGEYFYTDGQTEDDLYILDFSFDRETLLRCAWAYKSVTVLDHHKTAQEALTNWNSQPRNITIIFDMNRSGCGITWDWFNHVPPSNDEPRHWIPRPALINYVEDRDLWKFKLDASKEINAFIALQSQTFEDYSGAAATIEEAFVTAKSIGYALMTQHQKFCEQIVEISRPITIFTKEGTYYGRACNCTHQFASEVGNLLAQQSKSFGCTYFSDAAGRVKWSIRSIGDYDVSKIAQQFGGGGHKNAAGFTTTLNESTPTAEITLSCL